MSNIIDASERFSDQNLDVSKFTRRLQILEESVKSSPRLARNDRARMARNLGVLAARLSPDRPLESARQMFEKLGGEWQAKWRKRRRLLLLPDETLNEDDVVESGGATFVRLAKAAGELLAAGSGEPLVERSRLAALRDLLQGTMFIEELPPESASLATGRELLKDALDRIAQTIDQKTRLRELWSVLETAPFEIYFAPKGEEIDFSDELSVLRSQAVGWPDGSDLTSKFGPMISAYNDLLPEWSKPEITIGCLAIERQLRIFRFPDAVDNIFIPDPDDEWEETLSQDGLKWMAELGAEGGRLPDIEYDPNKGVGWQEQRFWQLYRVVLSLERNVEGKIEIDFSFSHTGRDGKTFMPITGRLFDDPDIERALDDGESFQVWHPADFPNYISLCGATGPILWGDRKFQPGQFLGYIEDGQEDLDEDLDPSDFDGPISDEWVAPFVFNAEGRRFLPRFKIATERPALLRPGSIGAALMQNLAMEDPEQRLDTFLCAAAGEIAEAGLAYHRSLVEHYRERLGTL